MNAPVVVLSICVITLVSSATEAQKPPVVRPIGAVVRTSTDALSSVATAVPMSGGRVLVNDITARRVLLFDSTLTKATVVADTTGATANAYGQRAGTLIAYRSDSALYIDIGALSMLVIGPTGKIERIMAVPRPNEAQSLIGSVVGLPGFDAKGRLVSFGRGGGVAGTLTLCCVEMVKSTELFAAGIAIDLVSDSALVLAADLATRTVDTVAWLKTPRIRNAVKSDDQNYVKAIETTYYPIPIVDDWAVTSDGSIAIVRGRDYHVDWLRPDGRWESSPKLPFDWQRLDDARKTALIDSTVASHEEANRRADASPSGAPGGGRGGGGGRSGGSPGGRANGPAPIPSIVGRPTLNDLPDYTPAFSRGSVRADADGNLWIRTSTMIAGQPVYDIVNRGGELADRVQLPPFRTIAGFAPGIVYMAVKDSMGVVRLERARVK